MYSRIFLSAGISLFSVVANGQMVGIGTNAPLSTLDVAGRIHFKHNGIKTPGIYFDGSTAPNRGFIGHLDDSHIGLFGVGSGWMLAMNFYTGHTSIGHSQPTATLDVQGGIRLRLPGAATGNTLTSADASGNAEWERPIAFKVAGSATPGDINSGFYLPNGQWVKPNFTNIPEYNIGLAWEPVNQVFVAPIRGLYHFDGHFQASSAAEVVCRIVQNRNGTDTDIYTSLYRYQEGSTVINGNQDINFSTDLRIEAGDKIRVELRGTSSTYQTYIRPLASNMFFSGRLITPL